MATIINNPPGSDRNVVERTDDSGAGVVVGVVLVLLVIILFFVFGLPYLRGTSTPSAPNTGAGNPSGSVNVQVSPGSLIPGGSSSNSSTHTYSNSTNSTSNPTEGP